MPLGRLFCVATALSICGEDLLLSLLFQPKARKEQSKFVLCKFVGAKCARRHAAPSHSAKSPSRRTQQGPSHRERTCCLAFLNPEAAPPQRINESWFFFKHSRHTHCALMILACDMHLSRIAQRCFFWRHVRVGACCCAELAPISRYRAKQYHPCPLPIFGGAPKAT